MLDWNVNAIMLDQKALQDVLDQYSSLFKEGIGTLQGVTVKILFQLDSCPRYLCPRLLPYFLQDKLNTKVRYD